MASTFLGLLLLVVKKPFGLSVQIVNLKFTSFRTATWAPANVANFKLEWKCFSLSSFLTLSQVTALQEGKCQVEVNGWLRSDLRAILPGMRGETWKGGVITQPFLKGENDNNHRRPAIKSSPTGVCQTVNLLLLSGCFGPGSKEGLLCAMWACESESGWKLETVFSPGCWLNRSVASQRNTVRARGLQERSHDLCWPQVTRCHRAAPPSAWGLWFTCLPMVLPRDHPRLPLTCSPFSPCSAASAFWSGCLQGFEIRISMPILERKKIRLNLLRPKATETLKSWVWIKVQAQLMLNNKTGLTPNSLWSLVSSWKRVIVKTTWHSFIHSINIQQVLVLHQLCQKLFWMLQIE